MNQYNEISATAVFVDIRNFTTNLNNHFSDDKYFKLVVDVYSLGIEVAENITCNGNFYINSTGDGFLCLFFDDQHFLYGYFYSLLLHSVLKEKFNSFFKVKKVCTNPKSKKIETYLGNVINIAARLESLTKGHSRAPIIYGPNINENIVFALYGKKYSQMMHDAKTNINTEKAQLLHEEMAKLNSNLLSTYLFEHRLKGVENAIPIFRISPTLCDFNQNHFWNLIEVVAGNLKTQFVNTFAKYGLWRSLKFPSIFSGKRDVSFPTDCTGLRIYPANPAIFEFEYTPRTSPC
jgi:hypothetical protein